MAPGIYNGGFRMFPGYPKQLKTWSIDTSGAIEFQGGDATRRSLSGFERGNPSAHRERILVSFDNADAQTALDLRQMIELQASYYERTFLQTTAGTVTSLTVVLSGAVQTDDYYNGLTLYNSTRGEIRVVLDYLGATRAATVDASLSTWQPGDTIYVLARPNIPTVFGISTDDNSANIVWYNMISSAYGILREQQIGRQVISIEFREVQHKAFIRDQLRIQP